MGLLIIVVIAAGLTGCGTGVSSGISSRNLDAFITDRVVTVRIVMTEDDWTACQQNALAEEYVRADFWFDGELAPNVAVRPKGNSSLRQTANSGRPRFSLKVDFNLFNRARNFRGFKKAASKGIKVKQCNVEKGLLFEDESFDVVVCSEIIMVTRKL